MNNEKLKRYSLLLHTCIVDKNGADKKKISFQLLTLLVRLRGKQLYFHVIPEGFLFDLQYVGR